MNNMKKWFPVCTLALLCVCMAKTLDCVYRVCTHTALKPSQIINFSIVLCWNLAFILTYMVNDIVYLTNAGIRDRACTLTGFFGVFCMFGCFNTALGMHVQMVFVYCHKLTVYIVRVISVTGVVFSFIMALSFIPYYVPHHTGWYCISSEGGGPVILMLSYCCVYIIVHVYCWAKCYKSRSQTSTPFYLTVFFWFFITQTITWGPIVTLACLEWITNKYMPLELHMAFIIFVKLTPFTNIIHVNKIIKQSFVRHVVSQVPRSSPNLTEQP